MCIIGILSENRGKNYCSESRLGGTRCVDKDQQVLRPAIIWCDSRAVPCGQKAFETIGEEKCLSHLLNSPGNFTASKLAWIKQNEPAIYEQIYKIMLPGDYIAMKLSGEICTTVSGLSEGMFWDFKNNRIADFCRARMCKCNSSQRIGIKRRNPHYLSCR